jgi:hypothetical protein
MELAVIKDCSIGGGSAPPSHQVLTECMKTSGMKHDFPDQAHRDWVGNIISRQAVVYSCGAIGRAGETLEHNHLPIELELCRQLSQGAADIMAGQFIGLGDEGDHELLPFYVTANQGTSAPLKITEAVVRSAFGGTLYPQAAIAIAPLETGGEWWQEVVASCEGYAENEETIEAWQHLVQWFAGQSDLHHPVFVSISNFWDTPDGNGSCVLPRLAVALTTAGSLVGLISCVVYT